MNQERKSAEAPGFACPCCRQLTYSEPPDGSYDICPICNWEDDPVQARDETCAGGANRVSLKEARENWLRFGAIEPQRRGP